ncbi:MAG: NAD(P)H quinone oxidoreductase [Gammaproteobacteria bacterium]|nr:MAG: NAD(P)H quinone oxidoreductase [Gammaproteobacteria bacterium]
MAEPYILVLYQSTYGSTKQLAYQIAQGVTETGMAVKIRTVASVASETTQIKPAIPDEGDLYCSADDLKDCAGLAMGSPTYFGNMSASLKYFLDNTVTEWMAGNLQNKPACVFTSTGSMHGGQETTLMSMMLPLLHHGMMIVGLPYSEPALNRTNRGGTPYGVTHVSGSTHEHPMSEDEKILAVAQGKRLAEVAKKLI